MFVGYRSDRGIWRFFRLLTHGTRRRVIAVGMRYLISNFDIICENSCWPLVWKYESKISFDLSYQCPAQHRVSTDGPLTNVRNTFSAFRRTSVQPRASRTLHVGLLLLDLPFGRPCSSHKSPYSPLSRHLTSECLILPSNGF